LLSKDKLMTRDNLQKRNLNKPLECVFCKEHETIHHLFFDCIVARNVWEKVSEFFGLPPVSTYLSVARFWLANTKHAAQNTIYSTVLWSIWKIRNALVFDNQQWICLKQVWALVLRTLRKWRLIFKDFMLTQVDQFSTMVTQVLRSPCTLPES
jgi:hypothetical protein